ncbi:MAG: helicase [Planctomycetaceae bacterium]|nr:helicase [Planctomycetaceae bacterium]
MIAFAGQDGLSADRLLGPGGLVAAGWPLFESRPQQLAMARKVQEAMRNGFHLAVEAGTGVGKSFAYLAGAIDQAIRQNGKVLISTHTINLQQQLIEKDIPFLQNVVPNAFTARLAKGRSNYLCRRRLEYAARRQDLLFDQDGQAEELVHISEWAAATTDGSMSDLPFEPSLTVWMAVQSEHGNCHGRKCPHFSKCFYWKARRSLESADIIVVNHALLFSDLVLKEAGGAVLPEFKFVILDEAHNIEHVAEDHFGIRVSQFGVVYLLDRLYNPRKRKGLLAYDGRANEARDLVQQCHQAARLFFAQVQAWYAHAGDDEGGRCQPDFVEDNLSPRLKELRLCVSKLAKQGDEDDQSELNRYAEQIAELETELKAFLKQQQEGCVYWVEVDDGKRKKVLLRSAPLDVGPYIKRSLLDEYPSVVLTSATLSCGSAENSLPGQGAVPRRGEGVNADGFQFFAGRVGLENYQALQAGSPFDYERQACLYIEADLPDPNDKSFVAAACESIKKYLLKSDGRAFVLFTSYSMLKEAAAQLEGWLAEQQMELLAQGARLDRARMLTRFKTQPRCVLFGTDSFWQGVDVPGESLSNVIIVKLPFAVPNHPLIQGRIDLLKQRGENPFFTYQLPMAIIKFKQGFGRLIRAKTDTGMVVVLDSRIVHKHYGRQFLAAIPKCRIEVVTRESDF